MGHQQQPKPTFPAYSNATISAPPTTNNPASTSTGSSNNNNETQKPPTIPQNTGTASKIIHPPEDISLEELKARRSQYRMNKFSSSVPTSSSASSISVSTAAYVAKANEAKMVAAAHEVSVIFDVLASIFTTFLITFWYMKICLNSIAFCVCFFSDENSLSLPSHSNPCLMQIFIKYECCTILNDKFIT